MGTKIEWTDETWNPVTGCTKVSAGCSLHDSRLEQPLAWREPRMVFVCSMSDLFHVKVTDDYIAQVFGVMAVAGAGQEKNEGFRNPKNWETRMGPHVFQVLTKREERAHTLLNSSAFRSLVAKHAYRFAHDRRDAGYLSHQIDNREEWGRCYDPGRMWPLSNVWLGVSVENQERANARIPVLLDTPAALRFVSYEPADDVQADGGDVRITRSKALVNHFTTCPEANQFSGRNRR